MLVLLGLPPALRAAPARVLVCRSPDGVTTLTPAGPAAGRPDGPAGRCDPAELPVALDAVRSAHWLPDSRTGAPGLPGQLILEGIGRGQSFTPRVARLPDPERRPPRSPALPIGSSLIAGLLARSFGIEGRASLSRSDDAVTLSCRPGTRPAGLVLDPGLRRLPDQARFGIRWHAEGDRGFSAGLAAGDGPADAAPLPPGLRLDPPAAIRAEVAAAPRFVVACPAAGGRITLTELALAAPEPAGRPAARSTWAWNPALWRDHPDTLLERARSLEVDRLYIGVDVDEAGLVDAPRLAAFVAKARAEAIAVVVVEGDPAMALPSGRAEALRRLAALNRYQEGAPAASRIGGIQYDIEPYLLPAYAADPPLVTREWATTVEALGAASRLPLDLVLPFWIAEDPERAAPLLAAVRRSATSLTVMAYRTVPEAVQVAAEPLLAFGTVVGLPVQVALEAGPVADEVQRTYAVLAKGAEAADGLLLPHAGGWLALLLDRPRPTGTVPGLRFTRESASLAGNISFLGDRTRLEAVANQMVTPFGAWSSFNGLALHGLID